MDTLLVGSLSALWLGIMTSISPCPLATNIVAISYIGRQVGNTRSVLLSGIMYSFGRMLTYLIIAIVVVSSIQAIPEISNTLQKYMNKLLGPILIIVGMFLLELLSFSLPGIRTDGNIQKRIAGSGVMGAGLLGMLFALSFCPTSAALFFGSLIPLSLKHESNILLPSIYGAGTALPVFVFSFLIAFSAQMVGKVFNKLTQIELWVRRITGGLFIIVGIYFCLIYIFRVL
ncbi:MAG: cytochrome C biogenesis protein [Chlorobiaceae bacterium]|nr:cytochrome C biogenesis protein [Chlorobiaceae bacterium]